MTNESDPDTPPQSSPSVSPAPTGWIVSEDPPVADRKSERRGVVLLIITGAVLAFAVIVLGYVAG